MLNQHQSDVNVVMEFDNIETIKRAVEIDAGVSLLPKPTVMREVETGTLAAVPILTHELVRPLGIIHRRGKDLGVTVRRFVELLRGENHSVVANGSHNGHGQAAGHEHATTNHSEGNGNGDAVFVGAQTAIH